MHTVLIVSVLTVKSVICSVDYDYINCYIELSVSVLNFIVLTMTILIVVIQC